jgi:hypothetical protein
MTMTCTFEGCARPIRRPRSGLCEAHYKRKWRCGDPAGQRAHHGDLIKYAQSTIVTAPKDRCVPWPFAKTGQGYGLMWRNGKKAMAHRYVCELQHGAPPSNKHDAAHTCGKGHEGCVNPHHLVWKTRAENMADKIAHGTHSRGEQHPQAKLTEKAVLHIRKAVAARTSTQADLARRYGVHPQYIHCIVSRRSWRWLAEQEHE